MHAGQVGHTRLLGLAFLAVAGRALVRGVGGLEEVEGGPEGGAVPRLATGGAHAARRAARSLGPVVFAVQGRALRAAQFPASPPVGHTLLGGPPGASVQSSSRCRVAPWQRRGKRRKTRREAILKEWKRELLPVQRLG